MRRLIVTADDFGLALPVNEAVEEAHCRGILTTASLMVSGEAAADGVARARTLPRLRVGLHVVVVEDRPLLPPAEIPALVDGDGRLPSRFFAAGVRFFLLPAARAQLRAEIRAQFRAFRETGLPLDHASVHNHMHLHPTIASLVVEIGREFGLCAVRLPYEPALPGDGTVSGRRLERACLWPWIALLRRRLRRAGLRTNDFVFGLGDSGHMTAERLLFVLDRLPEGLSEIYLHPATRSDPGLERTMSDYDHRGELAALLDPRVRRRVAKRGIELTSFSPAETAA